MTRAKGGAEQVLEGHKHLWVKGDLIRGQAGLFGFTISSNGDKLPETAAVVHRYRAGETNR